MTRYWKLIPIIIVCVLIVACTTSTPHQSVCINPQIVSRPDLAFTTYDFQQTAIVMQSGQPLRQYSWINPQTCYTITIVAQQTHEDHNKPVLKQTCRHFKYAVQYKNRFIGEDTALACRHFTTHHWTIY